jgi:peptidoglycan/xylan/chitin deacetylase (PgdA/CDA1 family)
MLSQLKTIAMPLIKRAAITAGLEAAPLLSPLLKSARGSGAIFTLHHVRPRPKTAFQPNEHLDITPEFLETAIVTLKQAGYQFIRLDEITARLADDGQPPFACFTLDDGYRDNAEFAAPIFSRHQVPFTIFLTKGYIDVTHSMWWETLAAVLDKLDRLAFDFGNGVETAPAATAAEKLAAFNRVADFVNATDEASAVARLDAVARTAGIDPLAMIADLTMREDELQTLAQNPLVSYGAHTISHRGLVRLPAEESEREIAESIARVADITGRAPKTFAYPYGDGRSVSPRERGILKSLGMEVAVTTRPGTVDASHRTDATAVPRISLNGQYQKARYVRALASGVPFKLMG